MLANEHIRQGIKQYRYVYKRGVWRLPLMWRAQTRCHALLCSPSHRVIDDTHGWLPAMLLVLLLVYLCVCLFVSAAPCALLPLLG